MSIVVSAEEVVPPPPEVAVNLNVVVPVAPLESVAVMTYVPDVQAVFAPANVG
jgi:hypothetical protein